MGLPRLLAHRVTRHLDIDDVETTLARRRLVREKPSLRQIYEEWYAYLASALPTGGGRVLELGSGPGFLGDRIGELISSELLFVPHVLAILDAQALPFSTGSLRAIVMTNVLHHVRRPRLFFSEATRCVRPGGVVVMIEPWVTPWSRIVYRFHHEPFDSRTRCWELEAGGPLSTANGAMPWILFHRDRAEFQREFPLWQIAGVEPIMPLRYALSGGVSMRSFVPRWTFPMLSRIERLLEPFNGSLAMFARITLRRVEDSHGPDRPLGAPFSG